MVILKSTFGLIPIVRHAPSLLSEQAFLIGLRPRASSLHGLLNETDLLL